MIVQAGSRLLKQFIHFRMTWKVLSHRNGKKCVCHMIPTRVDKLPYSAPKIPQISALCMGYWFDAMAMALIYIFISAPSEVALTGNPPDLMLESRHLARLLFQPWTMNHICAVKLTPFHCFAAKLTLEATVGVPKTSSFPKLDHPLWFRIRGFTADSETWERMEAHASAYG